MTARLHTGKFAIDARPAVKERYTRDVISSRSRVLVGRNSSYSSGSPERVIDELFSRLDSKTLNRLHASKTVLIKPTARHNGSSDHRGRMTSHPSLVRALVRRVSREGKEVLLGDAGMINSHGSFVDVDHWLQRVAEETGATPVSFVHRGARLASGRMHVPRRYPVSRVFDEVDFVINCANAQPHGRLVMAGAVKNMFNAVLGAAQSRLCALSLSPRVMARHVADVYGIVQPDVSLLDMTTVRRSLSTMDISSPGRVILGTDAVAVDAIGASMLGIRENRVTITKEAAAMNLGQANLQRIEIDGVMQPPSQSLQLEWQTRRETLVESTYAKATRYLNNSLLRQRSIIDEDKCEPCGECERICPSGAIALSKLRHPRIDYGQCVDCDLCQKVCNSDAIQLGHRGVAAATRKLLGALLR